MNVHRHRDQDLCIWTRIGPPVTARHKAHSDQGRHGNARSNETILAEGDTVSVIKDLKVKGSSSVVRRGSIFKAVHLTDEPGEIEVRSKDINGLVLRTEFVKKI